MTGASLTEDVFFAIENYFQVNSVLRTSPPSSLPRVTATEHSTGWHDSSGWSRHTLHQDTRELRNTHGGGTLSKETSTRDCRVACRHTLWPKTAGGDWRRPGGLSVDTFHRCVGKRALAQAVAVSKAEAIPIVVSGADEVG